MYPKIKILVIFSITAFLPFFCLAQNDNLNDSSSKIGLSVDQTVFSFNLAPGANQDFKINVENISGTNHYVAKFNGTNAIENSVIFDNGTNVGIGMTSPNAKLELATNPGNNYTDGIVLGQMNGDNTASIQTYIDDGAGGGWATRVTYNSGNANPLYIQKDAGDLILGNARGVTVTGPITASNLSGTNTGNQTITLTGGVTGSGTGSFAATVITNANLTGPITSSGNATSIAAQTGTGTTFVMNTSPTLVTPLLGTPTSGNFSTGSFTWPTFNQNTSGTAAGLSAILVPASGGTGIANNNSSTLTISGAFGTTLTVSGTTALTLPTSGTLYGSANDPLDTIAEWQTLCTNCADIVGDTTGTLTVARGGTNATTASITSFNNITGYTASGATGTTSTSLVFSTSPTLVTPLLGTPTSGNFSTGSFTWPTFNQNTTGTANNITAYTINQSVGTANSPTFAGLTLTGALGMGANTITSGLINGQTINATANFTGTMNVAGNVGIGTTAPAYTLDVAGSSAFGTGAEAMRIDTTGNVGIGTTAPSSRLEVVGNIKVTSGSFIDDGTNLNVPDYVFEPNYNLMTLDNLQNYVTQNQHFPGVPDMNDRQGWASLSLQDRDMKLLEKTEENTLYIIQNYKDINNQSFSIKTLENQLAAMTSKSEKKYSRLDNLGGNYNFLRTQVATLSDKTNFVGSAEPENIIFNSFGNASAENSTDLVDANYADNSFGGNYDGSGEYRQIKTTLNNGIDLSDYDTENAYLKFEVYLDNPDSFADFNAEIGNEIDAREIQWYAKTLPWFVAGWNEVKLPIKAGAKTGQVDWSNLNYFRIYFKFNGETNVRIKNVSIEATKTQTMAAFSLDDSLLNLSSDEEQNNAIIAIGNKVGEISQQSTIENSQIKDLQDQMKLIQDQTKALIDFSIAMNLDKVIYKDAENNVNLLGGKLEADGVVAGVFAVKVKDESSATIGTADISPVAVDVDGDGIDDNTGQPVGTSDGRTIFVPTSAVSINSKVFVTADQPVKIGVTEIQTGIGFKIETDELVGEDLKVDWWIVEQK